MVDSLLLMGQSTSDEISNRHTQQGSDNIEPIKCVMYAAKYSGARKKLDELDTDGYCSHKDCGAGKCQTR